MHVELVSNVGLGLAGQTVRWGKPVSGDVMLLQRMGFVNVFGPALLGGRLEGLLI